MIFTIKPYGRSVTDSLATSTVASEPAPTTTNTLPGHTANEKTRSLLDKLRTWGA